MTAQEELSALIDQEWNALKSTPPEVFAATTYVAAGGNLANLKRIVQLAAEVRLGPKLDKIDFPGPEQLWSPVKLRIIEETKSFLGELFDEFLHRSEKE